MRYSETLITTQDGHRLFVRDYRPPTDAPRTLLIVHGLCEHGERYDHVAREVLPRGWNVVVADLRGHGRSEGVRTHVHDFHQFVHDLELLRVDFGLVPQRTALLGHSMGGLVAVRYVQAFPDSVAALVLVSPLLAVKVAIHPMTLALGRVLSVVAPRVRFQSRINPSDTTRDPSVLERRARDPFFQRSVTAGWFFAMQAALRRAWQDADRVRLPLLVLQAGADRVVDPVAPRDWLEQTGSRDRTFRSFPDSLHELLNEPEWRDTTAEMLDWLEQRIPAADP